SRNSSARRPRTSRPRIRRAGRYRCRLRRAHSSSVPEAHSAWFLAYVPCGSPRYPPFEGGRRGGSLETGSVTREDGALRVSRVAGRRCDMRASSDSFRDAVDDVGATSPTAALLERGAIAPGERVVVAPRQDGAVAPACGVDV